MGGSSSSPVKEEEEVVSEGPVLPNLGNDPLAWKGHSQCIEFVEKLQAKSCEFQRLSDEQIGNILIVTQSSANAGTDSRRLTELMLVVCQAESSMKNIVTDHPRSSEIGLAQQNKQFGQRDSPGHWKEQLSKAERLDVRSAVERSHRILNEEQKGDNDWRKKELGQACYDLQRCEKAHDHIYYDGHRREVAEVVAELFYPNQPSMMYNYSPRFYGTKNFNAYPWSGNSNTFLWNHFLAEHSSLGPPYTRTIGMFSAGHHSNMMGLDVSLNSRLNFGQFQGQGFSGIYPGSTDFFVSQLDTSRRRW